MESNTQITVLFADDITDINLNDWKNFRIIDEIEFLKQPMSKRIEWVKNTVEFCLSLNKQVAIVANDYAFIRLLENFSPTEDFSIYHHDSDDFVKEFVDLKPNPTLQVNSFLFTVSVRKALKRDDFMASPNVLKEPTQE